MERSSPPLAPAVANPARRGLYPDNEPFASGWLATGGPHDRNRQRRNLRQNLLQQAGLPQQFEGPPRVALGQHLVQFVPHPLPAHRSRLGRQ